MIFALVDTWHQLPSISHQLLSTGKSLAININHVPLPRQFVGPDARIISGKNITWAICDLWDLQGASGLKCNDRAHFIGGPAHYQLEDASESKYPFHPKSPFCASLSESFVVSTVIENSLHITVDSPDNLYPCLCRNIQALLDLLHVHQVLWDGIIIIIVPAHRVKNWPDWVNISEYCHKFLQGGPPLTPVTTRAQPHMLCTQYQRMGSNVPVFCTLRSWLGGVLKQVILGLSKLMWDLTQRFCNT